MLAYRLHNQGRAAVPLLPRRQGQAGPDRAFAEDGQEAPGGRRLRQVGHHGRRSPRLARRETDQDARTDDEVLRGETEEVRDTLECGDSSPLWDPWASVGR